MTRRAPAPAASALRVRRHVTGEEVVLRPELLLGAGGEARVFALPGDGGLVAKVYHAPTPERARKLAWMVKNPPALPPGGGVSLAWPVDLLAGARGRFAGFVMPYVDGDRLFELYNPVTRRAGAPLFHWGLLHRAGANVAAAFDALHARGYVVGDVNESNFLVSPGGAVTVVDTDSFQVRDGRGAVFRSRVGKAEFTPPGLQGVDFADVDRTPEHDRFGLAVSLFLALMEGTHPFAARFRAGTEAPPLEERIGRGLFPYAEGTAEIRPPRLAPPFEALHPALRALFVTAFVDGHADPSARPTAAEWRAALEEAEAALRTCAANAQHRFGAHLDACAWCERARLLGGRDPFPATLEAAARIAAMPLPPRVSPHGPKTGSKSAKKNRKKKRARAARGAGPVSAPAVARPAAPTPALVLVPPSPWRNAFSAVAGWFLRPFPAPAPRAAPPPAKRRRGAAPAPPPSFVSMLLGPEGLLHPGAWILPMLVVLFGTGSEVVRAAGTMGLMLAGWLLITGIAGGRVRWATVVACLFLTLAALGVAMGTPEIVVPDPVPPAVHVDDRVYSMSEVDEGPALINGDEIGAALHERGVVGWAKVWATLATDGTVEPASIEVRTGSSVNFAEVARAVARRVRHTPAMVDGKPVRVAVMIPLQHPFALPAP